MTRQQLPRWKKLAFALSTALGVLLGLELALWACGVKPAYYRRDPYSGFTPQVPHFQVGSDSRGEEFVTVVPTKRESLNEQRFPRHKAAGTYRIVCLGGSAIYGRPFFDHTSAPGWLRAFLPVADPSRNWEVINAGAISYASYRIKGLMTELAQYEPDLFIVYMGENEFLERRTYAGVFETPILVRKAAGLASRTRLASATQSGLELLGLLSPVNTPGSTGIHEEVKHVPIYRVGPEAYKRDDAFKRQVLGHYEASLNAMVDIAAEADARLLFVTSLSNVRDFAPFKSENRADLTPSQLSQWTEAYERGISLAKSGKPAPALAAFDVALSIDDRHADLLFRRGKLLLALGKDKEAASSLVAAREEDICPLRACFETLETMRRVASERGVPLLDFERRAVSFADHNIPGEDLLADHVHMKIPALRMLALDILDELVSEKIVSLGPDWGPDAIQTITTRVEAGIDGPRYAHELYTLSGLLDALGQTEQSVKRVEEGLKLSGGDAEGFCLAGRYQAKLGRVNLAEDFYRRALAQKGGTGAAEEGLGTLFMDQGNPRAAVEHLTAAVRAVPESSSAHHRLGVALALTGQYDKAIGEFNRTLRLIPHDAEVYKNLGLAEERRGNRNMAIVHYREALRINPQYNEARANLARLKPAR
jgi:tetratricopeptide (TPR) repeat protein